MNTPYGFRLLYFGFVIAEAIIARPLEAAVMEDGLPADIVWPSSET
jgi:hypothetical protein